MADDADLTPYPVGPGHIIAQQLASGRGRLTSQMAALDDELAIIADDFHGAFEEADRRTTIQERITALAKTKRPSR